MSFIYSEGHFLFPVQVQRKEKSMHHHHNGYLDKYVVVLHQQGAAVNLSQELSRHHFV